MQNFAYLIGDNKTKECAVVDPAWDVDAILKKAEADGMKIIAGILTHSHFDHCNGVEELVRRTNAKVYIHEKEAKYLKGIEEDLIETREGSRLKIGDVEMSFLHTPGHTEGAQCILVESKLVSGDTLFCGACGRCDLPGGDENKMRQSLKRLAALDPVIEVYPGHAYGDADSSTIGNERRTNPFMNF